MIVNWNSILEGTSAGIAAALLLGISALSRDRLRNLILRFRIRKAFRQLTMGSGLDGITLGVSNHLSRGFRIRKVCIIRDEIAYRLNPTGIVETSFNDQHPKLTRKQKSAIKNGEPVKMGAEVRFSPWKTKKTPEGFVEVEPFTSQEFLLPIYLVQHVDSPVDAIQFVVEYDDYTGGVNIMKVDSKDSVAQVQRKRHAQLR